MGVGWGVKLCCRFTVQGVGPAGCEPRSRATHFTQPSEGRSVSPQQSEELQSSDRHVLLSRQYIWSVSSGSIFFFTFPYGNFSFESQSYIYYMNDIYIKIIQIWIQHSIWECKTSTDWFWLSETFSIDLEGTTKVESYIPTATSRGTTYF